MDSSVIRAEIVSDPLPCLLDGGFRSPSGDYVFPLSDPWYEFAH